MKWINLTIYCVKEASQKKKNTKDSDLYKNIMNSAPSMVTLSLQLGVEQFIPGQQEESHIKVGRRGWDTISPKTPPLTL